MGLSSTPSSNLHRGPRKVGNGRSLSFPPFRGTFIDTEIETIDTSERRDIRNGPETPRRESFIKYKLRSKKLNKTKINFQYKMVMNLNETLY